MTFAEVLPALAAGKVAESSTGVRYRMDSGGRLEFDCNGRWLPDQNPLRDHMSLRWEVIEEPAAPTPTPCDACLEDRRTLRATIARLERELAELRSVVAIKERETQRQDRELSEATKHARLFWYRAGGPHFGRDDDWMDACNWLKGRP